MKPKHDDASELALRSISEADKHQGSRDKVPLARWSPVALGTGVHRLRRLRLRVCSEEKWGWGWPLPLMAARGPETVKRIFLKKLFIVLRKLLPLQMRTSQVCSETGSLSHELRQGLIKCFWHLFQLLRLERSREVLGAS